MFSCAESIRAPHSVKKRDNQLRYSRKKPSSKYRRKIKAKSQTITTLVSNFDFPRSFWISEHPVPSDRTRCAGSTNRSAAIWRFKFISWRWVSWLAPRSVTSHGANSWALCFGKQTERTADFNLFTQFCYDRPYRFFAFVIIQVINFQP